MPRSAVSVARRPRIACAVTRGTSAASQMRWTSGIVNTLAGATSDLVRSLLRTSLQADASKSVRDASGDTVASRHTQQLGGHG